MRLKRKRRLIAGLAVILLALFGYAYQWKWSHRPLRHEFTTQRPGEPRRTWRRMRTAWEFQPGPAGAPWTVNDFFGNEERLYYVCDCEAGCLDPASGRALWRFPFLSSAVAKGGQRNGQPGRSLRLFPDSDRLYAYECQTSDNGSDDAFHLYALNPQTGKVLWSTQFLTPFAGPLCVAGPLLLLTDVDGTIKALRRQDGALIWQQRMTARRYPWKGSSASLKLEVADGCGVLQVGGGHLLGFRIGNGSLLWSLPATLEEARRAEDGTAEAFTVDRGIVYALLSKDSDQTLVALNLSMGKPLWTRPVESSVTKIGYLSGVPGRVVCESSDALVGLNTRNGKTAWLQNFDSNSSLPGLSNAAIETTLRQGQTSLPNSQAILYMQKNCDALVGHEQRSLRSVTSMNTLIAVEAATGQERWRWQPMYDMNFERIVVGKHRLYLSADSMISAIEDGEAEPLPDTPHERSMLARRLLYQQYKWPPPDESSFQFWTRLVAPLTMQGLQAHQATAEDAPDENEAALTLLEMGPDSVPPMLDFITHAVREQAKKPPVVNVSRRRSMPTGILSVLELLFDLADQDYQREDRQNDSRNYQQADTIVPVLAAQLEQSTDPGTRMALAETLIRLGDVRALRALFRYAQSPAAQPDAREDALYYVCRHSVPSNASPYSAGLPPDAPTQQEVTDWLLLRFVDRQAPSWIPLFARFELLRDRGEKARKAALATRRLKRQVHFLPTNLVLHTTSSKSIQSGANRRRTRWQTWAGVDWTNDFPQEIVPMAISREASGRAWAAFTCRYLGKEEELWFAQSQLNEVDARTAGAKTTKLQGKNRETRRVNKKETRHDRKWRKPAFWTNLSVRCLHRGNPYRMSLTCSNGTLHLVWEEVVPAVRNRKLKRFMHREQIPIADLYRDSDGDGLTDRVEKELGLNPYCADSNGNGIADGRDKNPLYKSHQLTEQEQIYQAVLEALCQLGLSLPAHSATVDEAGTPTPFGRTSAPIKIPAPPGSVGVEILGHTGMVLCNPRWQQWQQKTFYFSPDTTLAEMSRFHFCLPHIGLDGVWHGHDREAAQSQVAEDPFKSSTVERTTAPDPFVFKTYFPVVLSRSGTRARVGFIPDQPQFPISPGGFDVEVRKLGGRWLPVECRRVYYNGRLTTDTAVVPVRNRQDKIEMGTRGHIGF